MSLGKAEKAAAAEEAAKAEVRRSCTTNIDDGGGSRTETNRVIASVRVGSANATLTNVFIVDDLRWTGGKVEGHIHLSPTAQVRPGSTSLEADVTRYNTWVEYRDAIREIDSRLLIP